MEESRENRRRSLFAVWRWPRWKLVAVAGLALAPWVYTLSYAPLVKCFPGTPGFVFTSSVVHRWKIYRPARWLTERTLMEIPHMKWIEWWGVDFDFWVARQERDAGGIIEPSIINPK